MGGPREPQPGDYVVVLWSKVGARIMQVVSCESDIMWSEYTKGGTQYPLAQADVVACSPDRVASEELAHRLFGAQADRTRHHEVVERDFFAARSKLLADFNHA